MTGAEWPDTLAHSVPRAGTASPSAPTCGLHTARGRTQHSDLEHPEPREAGDGAQGPMATAGCSFPAGGTYLILEELLLFASEGGKGMFRDPGSKRHRVPIL